VLDTAFRKRLNFILDDNLSTSDKINGNHFSS